MIESVVDTGRTAMITQRGKMVALIVPMTVSELVRRKFESDPELKAQIDAALAEGQIAPVGASDLEA